MFNFRVVLRWFLWPYITISVLISGSVFHSPKISPNFANMLSGRTLKSGTNPEIYTDGILQSTNHFHSKIHQAWDFHPGNKLQMWNCRYASLPNHFFSQLNVTLVWWSMFQYIVANVINAYIALPVTNQLPITCPSQPHPWGYAQ